MRKRFAAALSCLALIAVIAPRGAAIAEADPEEDSIVQPAVIYGEDNRIDVYQVGGLLGGALKNLAASTVGLFDAGDVVVEGGRAKLETSAYSERLQLCKDEPFFDQRSGAFCTGALVGPDLVMTSAHCVLDESACKNIRFVFDFAIKEKGKFPESVPASSVYGCAKLAGRVFGTTGADWALIKLDRRVADRRALAIRRSGRVRNGSKLFVIGHPSGLPTKIAGGASVRDNTPKTHFIANLDTSIGSSGSPVFNALTGRVEGILVRGESDFEWRGTCKVSKRCSDGGCSGEEVTKVSELASLIPSRLFGAASTLEDSTAFSDLMDWSTRR